MTFDDAAGPHAGAPQHAIFARLYPLPDARLDALRAVCAERVRESGITLGSDAAFATLVLNMARLALYWSPAEVDARSAAERN